MFKRKDMLGLKDASREEITHILDTAAEMKKILAQNVKKVPHLQNKSVVTLFYENSTRTRTSFELAAKFMSAAATGITASGSSVQKGETLIDTGKTLDALQTDVIVIRHNVAGAPHLLAQNVRASVVNAGDGMNEHPTQALLDMFTMRERFGSLDGLKVAIAGDIRHSRVARSNIWGLKTMGAETRIFAPGTLLPAEAERLPAKTAGSMEELLAGANVVMGLRIQSERQRSALFPSTREYAKYYGINGERMRLADKNAILMHPGPVNRGVEVTGDCVDAENSLITAQVLNGLAVRMALLFLLTRSGQT
jgi:aspartate carbamoyltransferase catalytic subunit